MVKFTGHQRDAHGLSDYMLGRTCLWPLRRFASVDPGRDGWNLYAYVGNNPINFVDPTGENALAAGSLAEVSELLAVASTTAAEGGSSSGPRGPWNRIWWRGCTWCPGE